jgi:glycosyltransferase involved in cell wall biosynthesis
MVRFSIITVTFNSGRYLPEAMASVLSQDGVDLEYILVDGGSTDTTLELIRSQAAADPRVKWLSEPDEGIAHAFNKGLALATGEIIGILNSDDTYLPGALAAVAEAYRLHPEYDVFHGDMLRMQGQSILFRLAPADVETHIWREMPVNHPATFVTRRAYGKVEGFDVAVRIAMDYDLMLRLYKSGCLFYYIERPLAAMRYGGASDAKNLEGLKEVRAIAIREGSPRLKAWFWFGYKVAVSTIKNVLRSLGLYGLLRIHPRFRSHNQ